MVNQDNLKVDPVPTKEAAFIDTATHDQTPATTSTSPHLPTTEPEFKNTLPDKKPAARPSLPTSSLNTSTDSSALTTPATTSSAASQVSSKSGPKQPVTTTPDSVLIMTQSTIPKPKIIILHHDTVIDGRHIVIRAIQNCFTAILGPNAPQPSEAAILNAFTHNATLVDALAQLGAFKNLDKLVPSSAAGGTGAAAFCKNEITKDKSNANICKTTKGKDKEATAIPTTPPTQEEKQYEYQHAVALWTQAYLHNTHEFLSEFETYPDFELLNKQIKQQGTVMVILIAQDGFEPFPPQETSHNKDGRKDGDMNGKNKKQQQSMKPARQPAKGVKIIQELMRRMGVTAAGRGSRGYQDAGRQSNGGGETVVVDGIYACGINGKEVVRVWKEQILPGLCTTSNQQIAAALKKKADTTNKSGKGTTANANGDEKDYTDKGTTKSETTVLQKDEVIFACSSKQYLSLARAIGATACWVARCEDEGKMTEKQADIVVEDLEKLSQLIVSDISKSKKNNKGDEPASVVHANHSGNKSKTSTNKTKNQAPKNGNAALETEDIEMPDADHHAEASVEEKIESKKDNLHEQNRDRKLASPKAMKASNTKSIEDDVTAATTVTNSTKSPTTGKKRAREDDDLEEWLPVEMAGEKVPVVDLTEDA